MYQFSVPLNNCGTSTGNSIPDSSPGASFENVLIFQMDPSVQEVWDQARKVSCGGGGDKNFKKIVNFQPFAVGMLDVVSVSTSAKDLVLGKAKQFG